MTQFLNVIRTTYHNIFHEQVDHRSDDFFLMGSPWPAVTISVSYVYFVQKLGPRLMSKRSAYNVDNAIRIYNILNMAACSYILIKSMIVGEGFTSAFFCEPVDYSNAPAALAGVTLTYYYFLLKIVDLMDTVFFVLRKKNNQVTFLHVYHHAFMVIGAWAWAKYIPGGHGGFPGICNCFVHIWMYLYYFLSSLWPEYKSKLWWKKYITQLQMIQFVIQFFHSVPVFFVKNCEFPRLPCFVILVQATFFLLLFSNFYTKAYKAKKTI